MSSEGFRVLVGSQALAQHLPDAGIEPGDTDYFSDQRIPGAETFSHPALREWKWGDVATLDECYTIKVSHMFWTPGGPQKWRRHAEHLRLMQDAGAQFLPGLYDILYPIWEVRYGLKKANLNTSPEEFFTSTVDRQFEHDSIHAAVAFGEHPLFERILRDGEQVAVSEEKFWGLTHRQKIMLVQEEVFATAVERDLLKSEGRRWEDAYQKHLFMLITSYSKGWFPLFVVRHLNELWEPPLNYWERFQENKDRLVLLT